MGQLQCNCSAVVCGMPHRHWAVLAAVLPMQGEEGGRYRASFLWNLLTTWYMSTSESSKHVDAAPPERRGCLCLPEPECCYQQVGGLRGWQAQAELTW